MFEWEMLWEVVLVVVKFTGRKRKGKPHIDELTACCTNVGMS